MEQEKTSQQIEAQQKKLYLTLASFGIVVIGSLILWTGGDSNPSPAPEKPSFDVPSSDIKAENIRLASVEQESDLLGERLQALEKSFIDLKEESVMMEAEKTKLAQETDTLKSEIQSLKQELDAKSPSSAESSPPLDPLHEQGASPIKVWEVLEKNEDRHVVFEIPAGSVVKALLVSGADCSVAVQKPTGPNMVLLRPLDHGKLPRSVRVPLKGSVIIGNAIGDLASERVYIRAERMTLVEKNGSFVETELSAYVSGEDGREGVRGVVVDRSGQIITRAAFASFLSGVSQTVQATLNNQTLEKLAEGGGKKSILDLDLYRNSASQGAATGLDKLSEYYIKRAEQLQPTIQVAAGRVVDVIFTKTVRLGEKDLKKKLDQERSRKYQEAKHD